jgi:hypothetical protein
MEKLSWLNEWRSYEVGACTLMLLIAALIAFITHSRRRGLRSSSSDPNIRPGEPIEEAPSGTTASDRAIGWRPLYPYIKGLRFTKWRPEDLSTLVAEESCPLTIKLLISHRWQTIDDPDPQNKTLPTIIEYLSRVYMVANGFLDATSNLIKELVIDDDLRGAFNEGELWRCTCGSVGWLDLKSVLRNDDLFYERIIDIRKRRSFYRLLKHVRIWYDYSSLPQARETSEERATFDRALNRLAEIVSRSEVLSVWGLESINRAWCIFEALAAKKVYFCAPAGVEFSSSDKALFKAVGHPDGGNYRARPSANIQIHVNQFRSSVAHLNEQEIEAYLRQKGIDCSKDEDFARVARLINQYLNQHEAART